MSEKRKLFWCYVTWLNDGIYAATNIAITNPNAYIRIFITVKESFFWKGIQQWVQQFDYCNKTSAETNQRFWFESSHWQPDRYSEIFRRYFWKILVKEIIFRSAAGYRSAVLLKKGFFLSQFSRILPIDSVGKTIEQLVWRKLFQSEHFQWLLLFIPTIS